MNFSVRAVICLVKLVLVADSFCFHSLFAQNETKLNEIFERYYEETGKDFQIDQIEEYFKEPIVLKAENLAKIRALLNISRTQARSLLRLLKVGLPMENICDSLGFSDLQCSLLKYCTIAPQDEQNKFSARKTNWLSSPSLELKSRLYNQFPQSENYIGDKIDSYQKGVFSLRPFQLGVSFSKNAGELSYWENNKFFGAYENEFVRLVVGRFSYRNYSGIVLGEPFGVNKGSDAIERALGTMVKISPTLSSMQYGIFNGIALSSNYNFRDNIKIQISGFVSKVKRSGTLDSLNQIVTSVYTQDYFRDSSELKKKNTFDEVSYCIQSDLNFNKLWFGYSFLMLNYSKSISTASRKFIDGKSSNFHSLFVRYDLSNSLNFASEFSLDGKKNIGFVSNVNFKKRRINSSLNFRYFSEQFRSPFGAVLAENSYPNNELGLFYVFELRLKDFDFQFYSDFFKSLSPTYLLQVPYYGQEIFMQSIFSPMRSLSARLKIRRKEKTDYVYNVQKTKQLPYQKISYTFLLESKFNIADNLILKNRLDFVWINNRGMKKNENGFHTFFELNYSPLNLLWFGARINYFSTQSYESAIYVFEVIAPELMYSIPFYGKGTRITFWCNVQIFKGFSLYFKYYRDKKDVVKQFLLGQLDFRYQF
jgi:hypothetical protein